MEHKLVFKWGVSRGRDTYGYTICSLWVDDEKVAMCNGGGYDMKGTCFGNWVARRFEKELLKLEIPWGTRNGKDVQEYYGLTFHDPNYDPGKEIVDVETVEEREASGKSMGLERYQSFYKSSSRIPTENHTVPSIDGACGFSSVETILKAVGYGVEYIHGTSKQDIYAVSKIDKS